MPATAGNKPNGNDCSELIARLSSYASLARLGKFSALAFAEAGFCCVDDDVTCLCCGLTLGKWALQANPLTVHRERSAGQCDFVNRRMPPNVLGRVQCSFCQSVLRSHSVGISDRETSLHSQHFSTCGFAQGQDMNGSLPYPPLVAPISLDTAGESRNVVNATPKHADMAVEAHRLATFATWPSTHHVFPEALVEAGFFFTGQDDRATCFCCGGAVVNWPRDSDPWAEHARHFPSCHFVRQVKGQQFIKEERLQPADSISISEGLDAKVAESFIVDPHEIRARMDLPMVRIVLQLDYPRDLVLEVIRKRLAVVGGDFETPEELLDHVFATSDMNKRNKIVTEDNHQLKTQLTCKICLGSLVEVVFLSCGHALCCAACEFHLRGTCPICRTPIRGVAKVIFSKN